MLRPDPEAAQVFLHRAPIDMRKQMNGLSVLVEEIVKQDPFSGALFVFTNKKRDKLKMLYWERNGFVVWYKRLEAERFKWPTTFDEDVFTITGEQLNYLLDGYEVVQRSHRELHFSHVS